MVKEFTEICKFMQDNIYPLVEKNSTSCAQLLKAILLDRPKPNGKVAKFLKKYNNLFTQMDYEYKPQYSKGIRFNLHVDETYKDFVLSFALYYYTQIKNTSIPGICMFCQYGGGAGFLTTDANNRPVIRTARH